MQKNQTFENYQLTEEEVEFNKCIFKNSNFSRTDLSSYEFIDCTFHACDFSMSVFERLVLTKVKFINCKLMGVDFSKCSKFTFSAGFDSCILDYCFFIKNNLKKTVFNKCIMKEATFSESDLSSASFADCDLTGTVFEKCNLSECDFLSAQNYIIDPSHNQMKNAKFSYPSVLGLLSNFNIIIEQ